MHSFRFAYPQKIEFPGDARILKIAACGSTSLAVDENCTLYTWGTGNTGHDNVLWTPTKISMDEAIQELNISSVTTLVAGEDHSFVSFLLKDE